VDVLVAAAVLLAAVGVGVSALAHLRNQAAPLVECKENLHQFGIALNAYHEQHHQFPDVSKEAPPYNVAGMFVPMLINAGLLSRDITVRCPGNGPFKPTPYTLDEIHAMSESNFALTAPYLACCYAYSLGYRDEAGYHGPSYQGAGFPLVSDRSPRDQGPGNSFNHGGTGQNVLFQDGHVKFMTNRSLSFDSDIFRNKQGNIEAGCDPNDVVVAPSAVSP
jgi:prepilin-type processing-associated H-X9-DG protein